MIAVWFWFVHVVLRWTRNGEVINSELSLHFPEKSGSHLLITAERLVPTEVTTHITATIQEAAAGMH